MIVTADEKGRVELEGFTPSQRFQVVDLGNGPTLVPIPVDLPVEETWIFEDSNALASLLKGLEQAKTEEGTYLGDFSKYLQEEEEPFD